MKSTFKLLIFMLLSGVLFAGVSCSSKDDSVTPGGNTSGTTGGDQCVAPQKLCSGLCADVSSDNSNCGSCGVVCGTGQKCSVGACRCDGGYTNECGSGCILLAANHDNCGSCGTVCGATEVCSQGSCSANCATGLTNCSGGCVNPLNDAFNCGTCGNPCATGQTCTAGSCVCAGGLLGCASGCTNAQSDPNNCGACNNVCASGSCVGGVCQGASVTSSTTSSTTSTTTSAGTVTTTASSTGSTTTTTTTTTGAGGATSSTATTDAGTTGGNNPAGWWTYDPLSWHGCVWTGIDTVAGSTTTIDPQDFLTHTAGDPYCVAGTVHDNYDSVSLLGFNLAQDPAGADCTYDPGAATEAGPPGTTLGGSGIAINFNKSVASTLRIQIQGQNGATDAGDRWCTTITEVGGKVFVPYSEFNTECWEGGNGVAYNNEPISAVVFLVPGQDTGNFTDFGYCINGFATGDSADDAPDGGDGGGTLEGDIGGPGSDDNDYQRVKVLGNDGKQYIIQNNNWGNPGSSNQTLHYVNNSFKITAETGGTPGNGVPASFPSIFIGHNGDRQDGNFETTDANLPKVISSISSVHTTFKIAKEGGSIGGDYNAAYDVWFSANDPGTTEYEDGISGFLMIWLYKPGSYNPIGWESGSKGTFSHSTGSFNVYVGPRDGSSNRPVVNYVATSTITSMDFDLMDFIDDAVAKGYGIQSGWYLTDVFGGFEIWNGSGTSGLSITEFTAVVQ